MFEGPSLLPQTAAIPLLSGVSGGLNRLGGCPFKGNASYWNASAVGEAADDVMWAYESPFDEMLDIKDHGAFYPNKVRIEAAS